MTDDLQIDPREVKRRLDSGDKMLLVDIRQEWEHKTCRIEGATLVPMETMAASLQLFEAAQDVVLYCHHGVRSLNAVMWLRQQGVVARSMAGGIARWSEEIDPLRPALLMLRPSRRAAPVGASELTTEN